MRAELGQIVAGLRPGRLTDDEIVVFESTGTALQDVAAAAAVYERAVRAGRGIEVNLTAWPLLHSAPLRRNLTRRSAK